MEPTILKTTKEGMRLYEIAILLPGSLSDKERQEVFKAIDTLFAEKEVELLKKDEWKQMGLAYSIQRNTHGRYVFYYVQAKPNVIRDVEAVLGIERGILRHLVIKLDEGYQVVDWSQHFTEWKESLAQEEQDKEQQHEEKLKKQIIKRASHKTKDQDEEKEEKNEKTEEVSEKELEQKLGAIISDEDLNL